MEYFQMMPKSPRLFHLTKVNLTKMKFLISVNILNTFFKMYEKVTKDQLVLGLDK